MKHVRGLQLTPNATVVLKSRYLLKDRHGKVVESPTELLQRVARSVAEAERREKTKWGDAFYKIMAARRFLPNSPTLMNAGKKQGQLSACFVLPIHDSLDSIFDSLKFSAKIHQSGGGTGFSFSELRPKGSLVRSTYGVASGPISFMRIFDVATDTIKQGGARRGANMAILRVDHPDILEFIESKLDFTSISNFNLSVGVTDEFMQAVLQRSEFALKNPQTGDEVATVQAEQLFDRLVKAAWTCGDPGLVFLDRINRFNPTPALGAMESTNPCGEQPLLPYESCNLGSLNLGEYFRNGKFDWKLFREDIWVAVRFLDNVIDVNRYPVFQCEKITLSNRKIGLGVMGFADLLLMEGLSYSSLEAQQYGERLMSVLDREAKRASANLAEERGPFKGWAASLWNQLGYPPLRNATVSTVAPTGTISMIAGASSGIEPLFSGVFVRNVLGGERLVEIHPAVSRLLTEKGIDANSITDSDLYRELGPAWSPSASVSVENHVRMQAAFQRHSDSAVSKTINLPENASIKEVASAYLLAYRLGCKGITIYRDKSKPTQVLEHGVREESPVGDACPSC